MRDIWKGRTWSEITLDGMSRAEPKLEAVSDFLPFECCKRMKPANAVADGTASDGTGHYHSGYGFACISAEGHMRDRESDGLAMDLPASVTAAPRKLVLFQYANVQPIIEMPALANLETRFCAYRYHPIVCCQEEAMTVQGCLNQVSQKIVPDRAYFSFSLFVPRFRSRCTLIPKYAQTHSSKIYYPMVGLATSEPLQH